MAPAVPFALLGVIQLIAVATWLGLGAAACFPAVRRRTTVLLVVAALGMAGAEATTALRFGPAGSDTLGVVRLVALALLGVGLLDGGMQPRGSALPAVVVPLGAGPSVAIAGGAAGLLAAVAAAWPSRRAGADRWVGVALAVGLGFTAVATALADGSRTGYDAALAQLSARGAASAAFVVVLVLLARSNLLGKVVGAIVAGVVAMAVGSVAVVGVGVADEVQRDQSARLLSVAQAQQSALASTASRAGLFAKLVALCPPSQQRCAPFLNLFAVDPSYFAVIDRPQATPTVVAPNPQALSGTALVQLAGSPIVQAALKPSATSQTVASGPVLLAGSPSRLAVVAAVPGRPSSDARVPPSFAAVYGVGIVDSYLRSVRASTGYDVSVVANGALVASSLGRSGRRAVIAEARSAGITDTDSTATRVVPAVGGAPTVAFVPVTEAGNDDVRIATLAVSQPASIALAAQRSVLQRLVVTALVVLGIVAVLAFGLAQRIADPVRRLTVAAGRVRRGDLGTRAAVASRDEVGALARSFDAMTSSLQDMTGELRAAATQEALLRSRLETVVGSMNDGLVVVDPAGIVTSANPTALSLLGAGPEQVVGHAARDVLAIEDDEGGRLLDRAGERESLDGVVRRGDETVPVRMSMAPLADGQGRVVVMADRTREREVERMKSEFLANVSHELRTPLTPIRGYAELLARHPQLPADRVSEFVAEILGSTGRMNRVVELLVDVASLDAGRVTPARRDVSVGRFVDERLALWRSRYPSRAADLRRRVAGRLPAMDVDAGWLGRALDELADNAVKYTSRGPITLAATATADGRIRLAVRDTGDGVDTSRLTELLGDFSQGDASETRAIGGMGLGLGFVSRVVERLGLSLHVTSRPGRGSEFAIDVPSASRPAPSRRRSRPRGE